MLWRSSPTPRHSCAWPPPWSSKPTTNGRLPAATSPMSPWTNYALSSPPNTPLPHLPNNTKSPNVQHDSLITTREPTPDPKSTNLWDAIGNWPFAAEKRNVDTQRSRLAHPSIDDLATARCDWILTMPRRLSPVGGTQAWQNQVAYGPPFRPRLRALHCSPAFRGPRIDGASDSVHRKQRNSIVRQNLTLH